MDADVGIQDGQIRGDFVSLKVVEYVDEGDIRRRRDGAQAGDSISRELLELLNEFRLRVPRTYG